MPGETPEERRRRISEARSQAGARGAAARWSNGAANPKGPVNGPPAGDDDGMVFGNAEQLRRMAEALEGNDTRTLTTAVAASTARIGAWSAKHPRAKVIDVAGRPWCETLAAPRVRNQAPRIRVLNRADDTAELWIDGEISWWGILAQDVQAQLAGIDAARILVHLNSPGGDVYEGIAIRRALLDHPADVYVSIDGMAASIASIIAMGGETIGIDPLGMMMIHDASGFCLGNAGDMAAMADLLDQVSESLAGAYAAHVPGTKAKYWRDLMLAESYYFGKGAVDIGLADELLAAKGTSPVEDAVTRTERPAAAVAATAAPNVLTGLAASFGPAPKPRPVNPTIDFLRSFKETYA